MSNTQLSPGLPFGLAPDQPVFERATSMATAVFDGYASGLAIVHQGRMWRTRDPEGKLPKQSELAASVLLSGKRLWVEDLTTHPISQSHPLVAGGNHLRFYAGVPVRSSGGEVIGVLSVLGLTPQPFNAAKFEVLEQIAQFVADECDRQRARLALQETRSALGAFVATVPAAVMVTDREMRILEASPMWLGAFRLTLEQARGRSLYEIAPKYFEPFRPRYDLALSGELVHDARVPSPQQDGSIRYLRSELTPWRTENGEIGGIIGAALDITDMVEALESAERSQERLKQAVEIADLHVWEVDYERHVITKDGAESTFFDQEFDEEAYFIDTNITIDPRDRERIAVEWRDAVLEGRPYRPEYRTNRLDGKEVWATCAVKLVRNEAGEPVRLIGAMQNITERKKSEAEILKARDAAEAANRAKSTFLATMSHEIRTPLNGVLGMAQAMAHDDLAPVQRERLQVISQSGASLLSILNDILDFSKIEAGKLELEVTGFDLTPLIESAQAAFGAVAEAKNVDLILDVSPTAAGRYQSDPTRIRQILYNFVSNALKFTDKGSVRLAVSPAKAGLWFQVTDTGLGMSKEVQERLFQKFEQADVSTTRKYGGTGLGLAICRELAELLGGQVSVSSREGEGSVFTLFLPMEREGEELGAQPEATHDSAIEGAGALRVLAAEDNAVNQLVLRTLLAQIGIQPTIVADGRQAFDAWRGQAWDVVLMDVQMPVMDGPTAVRKIRKIERDEGRPATPIIALTANAMAHQIAEYRAAGMDGFVAKPIEALKLFEALGEALDGDTQAGADEITDKSSAA